MSNPWTKIRLSDYEGHMSHESVGQAEALSAEVRERLAAWPDGSVMLFGAAGGNGLEHVPLESHRHVWCVDLNDEYLRTCRTRFADLGADLETICTDLAAPALSLPHADILIADLIAEYIGLDALCRSVQIVAPEVASVIIQRSNGDAFVTSSPYAQKLSALDEFHNTVDPEDLVRCMQETGYTFVGCKRIPAPGAKTLLRLDFRRS